MMRTLTVGLCLPLALLAAGCRTPKLSEVERMAANGDAEAQYACGITLLVNRTGRIYRPEKAYPWLLAAAKQGLPKAQAVVALCLERGWGVQADAKAAEAWYKRAVERGQSGAAMQLASNPRTAATPKEAAHWLETAMAHGRATPEARLMLASLYLKQGMQREAVQQLRFAALDGSAEAAYVMSLCYESGVGVPRDERLMRGWLKNAADMGYKPAKARLREMRSAE